MKEFAIWGIPPDKTEETLLHTKAESLREAETVKRILESRFGCRRVRIQIMNLSSPPNFKKAITI